MRLIDADALEKAIYKWMPKYEGTWMDGWISPIENLMILIMMTIQEQPTVDAEPVRHGKWVGAESQCGIGCPFCGTPVDDFCVSIDYINLIYEPNYCPNCGAKMDGERKDNETD